MNTRYILALCGYGLYSLGALGYLLIMTLGMSTTARASPVHFGSILYVILNMGMLIGFPFIRNKRSAIGYITGGTAALLTTVLLTLITFEALKPDYTIMLTLFYMIFAVSAAILLHHIITTLFARQQQL